MDIDTPCGSFTMEDARAVPESVACAEPSCANCNDECCMPGAHNAVENHCADMSPMAVEAALMIEDLLLHRQGGGDAGMVLKSHEVYP